MGRYSRLGIGLLVAVWATVLLVSPLRRQFCEHWQNSWDARTFLEVERVLPYVAWRNEVWLYPNDKNLLLQAARVSPVVERYEIVGGKKVPPPVEGIPLPKTLDGSLPPDKEAVSVPVFRPHPLFPGTPARGYYSEALRRLHILVEKYPDDIALKAMYLRSALPLRTGRVGGEMADVKLRENRAAGRPSPEVAPEPPEYTAVDLQQALDVCEAGRKLDPDNAFFDWMKCIFLMLSWRDEQAFQALEAAGSKTFANDYNLVDIDRRMQALATVLQRPLTLEERQLHMREHPLPVLGRYLSHARLIAWQAVKAQRRGDMEQAWHITAGLMRVAALMRQKSSFEIQQMSVLSMAGIARNGITYDWRQARIKTQPRIPPEQSLKQFMELAKKQGHADLAELAKLSFDDWQESTGLERQHSSLLLGTSYERWLLIEYLRKAGALLLVMLPTVCVLLAVLWWGEERFHFGQQLSGRSLGGEEIPTRGAVRNGACKLAVTLFAVPMLLFLFLTFLRNTGVSLWAPGVSPMAKIYLREQIYVLPFFPIGLIAPLFLGGLVIAWSAIHWQKRANGERVGKAVSLGSFCYFMVIAFGWYLLILMSHEMGVIFCAFFLPLVLLAQLYWTWRIRPLRRATVGYGLSLWQRSLAVWLVVASVLYLGVATVTLPLRQQADVNLQLVLTKGERRN